MHTFFRVGWTFLIAFLLLATSFEAQAEDAQTEGDQTESAADSEEAAPESEEAQSEGDGDEESSVDESVERFGRVEMVLIENEDPESALEFAQEALEQDGDTHRLRLLMGACAMRLERYDDAITHFRRSVELAPESSPSAKLQALYNLARAFQGAGQFRDAAQAYDDYVEFARQHEDVPSFIENSERLAAAMRSRSQRRRRGRRR